MPKDFKTYDELITLLESRNVMTNEHTKVQLMRESYYAIVNGYKDPFLDTKAMEKLMMIYTLKERNLSGFILYFHLIEN